MKILRDAGYNITYELLNAADYKIPQDRFRVFFIGIRKDLANKFVFPNAVSIEPITLKQAIGDIVEAPRFYCDEIVKGDHPERLNHDVYTGPYDAKYMARNRVRSWNETSFTMQAQARNAPLHPQAPKMIYVSPSQRCFAKGYEHLYRRLSVRECARIQTFPDSFKFIYKDVKDGYKMVGNAVPPRLAWYLALQMKIAFADLMTISKEEKDQGQQNIKQVPITRIAEQYPNNIVDNTKLAHSVEVSDVEMDKRVLIGLVKSDNIKYYEDCSAKIYYTGKKFPTTIALNKLYYFMPYIKGHGVRDLYLIKIARVGTRKEGLPDEDPKDIRLVFEIEFIKHMYSVFMPIHLNIWRTFTDTILGELLKLNEDKGI